MVTDQDIDTLIKDKIESLEKRQANLTTVQQIGLLIFNLIPSVVNYNDTVEQALTDIGSFTFAIQNADVITTDDIHYTTQLPGQTESARVAWQSSLINVGITVANAAAMAATVTGNFSAATIRFYQGSAGALIDVINIPIEFVQEHEGNLINDDPSNRITPTESNADKILWRSDTKQLYSNELIPAVPKDVNFRTFTDADLRNPTRDNWAGVITTNPTSAGLDQHDIFYSTHSSTGGWYVVSDTVGSLQKLSGSDLPVGWRDGNQVVNMVAAVARATGLGDVIQYGTDMYVVDAFRAAVPERRAWVPFGDDLIARENAEEAISGVNTNRAEIENLLHLTSDIDLKVQAATWINAQATEASFTLFELSSTLGQAVWHGTFDPSDLSGSETWQTTATVGDTLNLALLRVAVGVDNLYIRYALNGIPENIREHSYLATDNTWNYYRIGQVNTGIVLSLQKREDESHTVYKGELPQDKQPGSGTTGRIVIEDDKGAFLTEGVEYSTERATFTSSPVATASNGYQGVVGKVPTIFLITGSWYLLRPGLVPYIVRSYRSDQLRKLEPTTLEDVGIVNFRGTFNSVAEVSRSIQGNGDHWFNNTQNRLEVISNYTAGTASDTVDYVRHDLATRRELFEDTERLRGETARLREQLHGSSMKMYWLFPDYTMQEITYVNTNTLQAYLRQPQTTVQNRSVPVDNRFVLEGYVDGFNNYSQFKHIDIAGKTMRQNGEVTSLNPGRLPANIIGEYIQDGYFRFIIPITTETAHSFVDNVDLDNDLRVQLRYDIGNGEDIAEVYFPRETTATLGTALPAITPYIPPDFIIGGVPQPGSVTFQDRFILNAEKAKPFNASDGGWTFSGGDGAKGPGNGFRILEACRVDAIGLNLWVDGNTRAWFPAAITASRIGISKNGTNIANLAIPAQTAQDGTETSSEYYQYITLKETFENGLAFADGDILNVHIVTPTSGNAEISGSVTLAMSRTANIAGALIGPKGDKGDKGDPGTGTGTKVSDALIDNVAETDSDLDGIQSTARASLDDSQHLTVRKVARFLARVLKKATDSVLGLVLLARNEDVDATETDTSRVPTVETSKRLINRTAAESAFGSATDGLDLNPADELLLHQKPDMDVTVANRQSLNDGIIYQLPDVNQTVTLNGEDYYVFPSYDVTEVGLTIAGSTYTANIDPATAKKIIIVDEYRTGAHPAAILISKDRPHYPIRLRFIFPSIATAHI